MKRCIFHYPEPVADNPTAGSALRPNRMLHALRSIGYEVEEVTGYSSERRKKIDQIRQQIQNGMQYDFVYSENINSPTLLADQDHIPRHPWMDFQFFRFCKSHQIPVLLFYRDIYWKFPDIFNGVASFWKRSVLIPLFRYDLRKYRSCLDLMFLPTERMHTYVDLELPYKPLPPWYPYICSLRLCLYFCFANRIIYTILSKSERAFILNPQATPTPLPLSRLPYRD